MSFERKAPWVDTGIEVFPGKVHGVMGIMVAMKTRYMEVYMKSGLIQGQPAPVSPGPPVLIGELSDPLNNHERMIQFPTIFTKKIVLLHSLCTL